MPFIPRLITNMSPIAKIVVEDIPKSVARALDEDIGTGDITAQLIDATKWLALLLRRKSSHMRSAGLMRYFIN